MVSMEIKSHRAIPHLVISWYRPPSHNVETFVKLECVLGSLESKDKEWMLLGDTDCDYSLTNQEESKVNLPGNVKQVVGLCTVTRSGLHN